MDTKAEDRHASVKAFFDEQKEFIGYLYDRWQDERDYEDIEEYAAALRKRAEKHGLKVVKAYRRPFGFTIKTNTDSYRIKVTRTKVSLEV